MTLLDLGPHLPTITIHQPPQSWASLYFLVQYGLGWSRSQGIREQDICQEQVTWIFACVRCSVDGKKDGWQDLLTRGHGGASPRMSKHVLEGCDQIQEDCRVSRIQRQGPSCSVRNSAGHSGLFLWSIVYMLCLILSSVF